MTFFGVALLAAIATIVLAVFAIVTAWYAGRAFRGQADELGILKDQLEDQKALNARQTPVFELQARELQESLDERKRQAESAHRAQASRVFLTEERFGGRASGQGRGEIRGIGTKPPSVTATAHNTSDQPVYDAELRWHLGSAGHGDPNPEPIGTLLPGDARESTRDFPPGTN